MERKPLFAKKTTSAARAETFAMRVESYDTSVQPKVVKGVRIDNDEPVTVYLRDVEYNSSGRFKRSEIADFAAPRKDRQHPGTAAGGTLLIQEAMPQANGTFGARWIQSLSHTEGEAEVFVACVHVTPVKKGANGKDYALMTVLHDGEFGHLTQEMGIALKLTPPFKVDSLEELKEAVTTLLDDSVGVGVRVSNGDNNFDALYVSKKKDMTVKQAVDAFMASIAEMAEAIESGALTCEVIPYGNVWAGPATTEIMTKNKVVQSRLARFNEQAIGINGNAYPVSVFRPAIVAARMTKADEQGKRSVFFSHFEPLYTRQPVHGLVNAIAHARTEHLAPEPPKPAAAGAKPAAAAPAAAPDAGPDSGLGSFDGGGFMDEDLMVAAEAGQVTGQVVQVAQQAAPVAEPEVAKPAAARGRYAGRRS